MSIVTNSSADIPQNVYAIHKLFKPESELNKLYEDNKGKYKVLKEALIEDTDRALAPRRKWNWSDGKLVLCFHKNFVTSSLHY